MCGLIVIQGRESNDAAVGLKRMKHRGLVQSVLRAAGWTLGRTRLPIVGLDHDFDPPYSRAGWTFNFVGELLDFRAIAPTVRCDVEVLARGWIASGAGFMKERDGFWSVAAVDPTGNLHVLVDYLAQKPLYYRTDRVAYASEIGALTHLGPSDPDPVYFSSVKKFGYSIGRRTWCAQVRRMLPGEYRVHDPSGSLVHHDEEFDLPRPLHGASLRGAVERAVRRRVLSSDVPVAVLLSGGLDSSIVYLLAKGLGQPLKVYHAPNDEGDFLNLLGVAEDAQEVVFDHLDDETVLRANEGPVDLGSVFPQYALGQSVRERVALSGDGADELFGGYRRALEYDSQGSDVFDELVHYHLPRLDKLMMAGTVELRSPFLAREVVGAALAIPYERRVAKSCLKEAFADLVPFEILNRPKMPLKTKAHIDGGVSRRRRLCDIFQDMIVRGVA